MEQKQTGRQPNRTILLWLGGCALLLPLAALARVLFTLYRMRHASRPGREVSARISPTIDNPLTTVNRAGRAGDPINIQILGSDGQIGAAFAVAGWQRADEIDLVTSVRISVDVLLGRAYSSAPVSNLYLFGRKEDLAFERPGQNVRRRDHIRLWKTGKNGRDGRPVWIGSATRDVKVELSKTDHLPTHGIAPDLDAERALVVSELTQTGYVVKQTTRPGFGKETEGVNGGGDPYFTDGQVAVLSLANVWTLPIATQVRGHLAVRIARGLSGFVRKRLPREGREQAAQEQKRVQHMVQINK